jgi:5-methylcytosine-specific restriction endonuclease McrA
MCQRKYERSWYLKNRVKHMQRVHEKTKIKRKRADEFIYQYLSTHDCQGCGEKDPMVLTFDHIDPLKKRRDISIMRGMGYSLKTIQIEVDKCQVLCFNCHVRKHRRNTRFGAMVENAITS